MKYIRAHPEYGVDIFYSTPSIYVDYVHKYVKSCASTRVIFIFTDMLRITTLFGLSRLTISSLMLITLTPIGLVRFNPSKCSSMPQPYFCRLLHKPLCVEELRKN